MAVGRGTAFAGSAAAFDTMVCIIFSAVGPAAPFPNLGVAFAVTFALASAANDEECACFGSTASVPANLGTLAFGAISHATALGLFGAICHLGKPVDGAAARLTSEISAEAAELSFGAICHWFFVFRAISRFGVAADIAELLALPAAFFRLCKVIAVWPAFAPPMGPAGTGAGGALEAEPNNEEAEEAADMTPQCRFARTANDSSAYAGVTSSTNTMAAPERPRRLQQQLPMTIQRPSSQGALSLAEITCMSSHQQHSNSHGCA